MWFHIGSDCASRELTFPARGCGVAGMRVLSPAKINLHLRVGPVNEDGFHPLVSWMVAVGLFDILDFALDTSCETAGRVEIVCADPTLPTDERNLIVKAARLLAIETSSNPSGGERTTVAENDAEKCAEMCAEKCADNSPGLIERGVRVRVAKAIPMGGGLGGGSSNAAATLVALNELWELKLDTQRLSAIACRLGSDVPFFLNGNSSFCTGRGEVVQPIHPPACPWVVLILPNTSMPTPAVYQRFDDLYRTDSTDPWNDAVDWAQWSLLPAEQLLRRLQNDLETPAFSLRPDLGVLRQTAEQHLSRPVRMSGSGSTLFTLFDTQQESETAAREIQTRLNVRTVSVRIGSV